LHRELLELRRICLINRERERERERRRRRKIHMSLGEKEKKKTLPKVGHSYSAIALWWLLAKKNKSVVPKR